MKTLVILVIILTVLTIYFVFNTEKSISVKSGGNAIPAGTDVTKFILDKAKTIEPGKIIANIINGSNLKNKTIDLLQSDITEKMKSTIGEIKNKILNKTVDLIKKPIESKISETFCPQK